MNARMRKTRRRWSSRLRNTAAAIVCIILLNEPALGQAELIQRHNPAAEPRAIEFDDPLASIDMRDVEVSAALQELVQQLDDESYETREQANKAIVTGDFELAQVCAILTEDHLSLEQRHRLLVVAREILLRTPRGALGIEMRTTQPFNNGEGAIEIEVMRLLPGLPAERVLRVGDRITHIDGVALRRNDDLIRYTQVRQPGSPVRLTIRRVMRGENGEAMRDANDELQYDRMDVSLELGSAELLRDADGGVQRAGPIVQQREVQAIRLAQRYGTKAKRLELEPGATSHRPTNMAVALRHGDDWVEEHHYIKELRRDIKFIQSGAMNRAQRAEFWNQRLLDLQRMIEDERTSLDDREFLMRVQRRFLEIITEM